MGGFMDNQVKILMICNDEEECKQLIPKLKRNHAILQMITFSDVYKQINQISPHIVILMDHQELEAVEMMKYIQHELGFSFSPLFLYLAYQKDFVLLRDLFRQGMSDYFVLPEELPSLNERLEHAIEEMYERINSDVDENELATGHVFMKGSGAIYAFYSGKGGVGRSLLATLYAQTLQFESTAEVLFIDLNIQHGGAETFLGIDRIRSYAELLPVMDELNENHIRNVAVKETYSNLDLLLSPQDAEVAEQMTEEHVTRLLTTCKRVYDIVILDLPSHMDAKNFAALQASDIIYYVMTLDTPSIVIFKRVQDLLKRLQLEVDDRMQVILNRLERTNELSPSDVNEFITHPIGTKIKEDKKNVLPLINKGEPLRKESKEKKLPTISKQVRKWVRSQLK